MNFAGMSDRDILVHLATKQEEAEVVRKERNEQNDNKFKDLDDEDDALHHRINDVHTRVNTIKFWSMGSAGLGSLIGSFLGWLRITIGK